MIGVSSAVLGKQPQGIALKKSNPEPGRLAKSAPLWPFLQRDEVHFAGRRKRTPEPSESDSGDSYDAEESASPSTSSSREYSFSSGSLSDEKSNQDLLGHRYNLRKRNKVDTSVTQKPAPPADSAATTVPPSRRLPDAPPVADDANLRLLVRTTVNKAFADFLKTPMAFNPNGPESSDSDSEDAGGSGKIQVVSYKQSPFGPGAERLGFKRIAGMEGLKADLNRLLVDQIQHPQIYKDYGLEHSASGVLLYGPPGNGKTFFAKAVAEEAGANFLEIHPSSIASPYIHETSKFIGEAFDAAAKMAKKTKRPTVLLIDEVDAMAPQRQGESVNLHHNEEVAEFLNQLNECARKNVFVVATTNLPDMLDPALVRSGRMNAKIYVGAPDEASRQQVLGMYLQKRAAHVLDEQIDVAGLARKTQGYSIADLRELVNQGARLALQSRAKISDAHLKQALKTVKPSVSEDMADLYKQMIAKFETQPRGTDEAWRSLYT
ncbi:ATP-binding protein [Vampirovibrio chlorellavorus]|uniref:ATP-binding protein n=1 Tax=Vampirovibrio chlorellavorus TaxID=758823 RepID=UPI0026F04208|nr:ATP-binding protein [Vampirovibrio chlorellavorus]